MAPNLVIDKRDDPDPVSNPEDILLYTILVQNQGNTIVENIAITDNLPVTEVDFITVESSDFDCQNTRGVIQCSGGTLGVGEIGTVEIVVEPEVAGTIRNTAVVFANRVRIDEDTEDTLVREPAVADEDEDDGDGDNSNDGDDNSNNGNDNDGTGRDEDDFIVVISGDDNEVIKETIPGKVLPFTGGVEGGAAGAAVLLGGGALVLLGALVVRFVRTRGL